MKYEPDPGNTWGFTYLGAAAVTGLFILVTAIVRPPRSALERVVYLIAALALMVGTMPHRKGIAIALDSLTRGRSIEGEEEAMRQGRNPQDGEAERAGEGTQR